MRRILLKRGQNLTEVALVIAIVGLVFIGMQTYIKRSLQAKTKDLTDNMIGREHSDYQQDISGLTINSSTSSINYSSTATQSETSRGKKSAVAIESSTADSTSYSQDN